MSGATIAKLDEDELRCMVERGCTIRDLKRIIADGVGHSNFRQRLFTESGELQDDMPLAPWPSVRLVLDFNVPDETMEELLRNCNKKGLAELDTLLQERQDPNNRGTHGKCAPRQAAPVEGNSEVVQADKHAGPEDGATALFSVAILAQAILAQGKPRAALINKTLEKQTIGFRRVGLGPFCIRARAHCAVCHGKRAGSVGRSGAEAFGRDPREAVDQASSRGRGDKDPASCGQLTASRRRACTSTCFGSDGECFVGCRGAFESHRNLRTINDGAGKCPDPVPCLALGAPGSHLRSRFLPRLPEAGRSYCAIGDRNGGPLADSQYH